MSKWVYVGEVLSFRRSRMGLSFETVVDSIEAMAAPAPDLIRGLFEVSSEVPAAYSAYVEVGAGLTNHSGIDFDTEAPLAFPPKDLSINLDPVAIPFHAPLASVQALAPAPPSHYSHDLGSSALMGDVDFSLGPSNAALSLSTSPPLFLRGQDPASEKAA